MGSRHSRLRRLAWGAAAWSQRARLLPSPPTPPCPAEETPIHSKLLLHYARRLASKQGALPPPDLPQLIATEAALLVSRRGWRQQQAVCGSVGRPARWRQKATLALLHDHSIPWFASLAPQEALEGDLLVFSPYPSLSAFLRDSRLAASQKTCEAAW